MAEAAADIGLVRPDVAEASAAAEDEPTVQVKSLAGTVLAEVKPIPNTTLELKVALEELLGRPVALQKLVVSGSMKILSNDETLAREPLEVLCLHDETPLWTWDLDGNPQKEMLTIEMGRVTCPNLRTDYLNVLTKEPMRSGRHYFEFVMHHIGDEQWCGVVANSKQAGSRVGGRSLTAWTYYCGRMRSHYDSLKDGKGALHAEGRAVVEFAKPQPSGDVIGMLVDLDAGAIAFDLNGELQGACAIPVGQPLWVITHVDTPRDDVELRKPSLVEAAPANLEALSGALLDISKGEELRGGW